MPIFAVDMRFTSEDGVRAERFFAGEVLVFRSITEAAKRLGVTPASVSYALKVGKTCKGYSLSRVPRVWVVKSVDDEYLVCQKEDGRFRTLGNKSEVLYPADLVWMKEITETIYGEK